MSTLSISNSRWSVSPSDTDTTLETKDTYLDKDIVVKSPTLDVAKKVTGTTTATSKVSITTNPTVKTKITASSASSTYGWTTSSISGTEGTNYIKATSSTDGVSTNGVATSYHSSGNGYITSHTDTTGGTANISSVTNGTGTTYYQPIVGVSFSGGGLTKESASGGGLSGGGLTAGAGSCSLNASSNLTTSTSENKSGCSIQFKGSGTVNRAAVTRAAFSQKVSLAQLTYSNSAGAIASHSGTQALGATSQTVSLSADSSTIGATSLSSNSANSSTYYINGITLGSGKQFDVTNGVTNTVTIKYNTDNCLDFVFS